MRLFLLLLTCCLLFSCTTIRQPMIEPVATPAEQSPVNKSVVTTPAEQSPVIESNESVVSTPAEQSMVNESNESVVSTPAEQSSVIESIIDTEEYSPTSTSRSPNQPFLDIDSGGHKTVISNVLFTPDGHYLVSAGHDKVIRVWDIAKGQTVRILRGQSTEGQEGQINAMALSPNGLWLAVGGSMRTVNENEYHIRLYNFKTGEIIAILQGHKDIVMSLAFSPNNLYLVSGSRDKKAIVWSAKRHKLLQQLSGHVDIVSAVAFTPDSKRVVTGSYDHTLRLWQVNKGKHLATLTGHADEVRAVTISRRGIIASGSQDNTIRLWDGKTGKFIKVLANQGTRIGSLSFSPNGLYLVSGGSSAPTYCYVWSVPNGEKIVTYQGHDNVVFATAVSPDGQSVATGGGNKKEIHLWSLHNGKLRKNLTGTGTAIQAVGFSTDGQQLAWGNVWTSNSPVNRRPLTYQLTLPTSEHSMGEPQSLKSKTTFRRAQLKWQDWSLRARAREGDKSGEQAVLEILKKKQVMAHIERGSIDGRDHRTYTFTPDGKFIISGGINGILTQYDRSGTKIGDYVGHTGAISTIAVSPDGELLVSGSADQTIRLWSVATQENLLTLFYSTNGEWVAWTPTGYYASSPKGDSLIGWQINRGIDKAADYVTAAQLRPHFYRPDIVENTLRLRSEHKALEKLENKVEKNDYTVPWEAEKVNQPTSRLGWIINEKKIGKSFRAEQAIKPFELSQLVQTLPPQFHIVDPSDGTRTRSHHLSIKLRFVANSESIQDENIEIYVNDSKLNTGARKIALPKLKGSREKEFTIPFFKRGENLVRVVAKNRIGETVKTIKVYFDGNREENIGNLYLVAIGVSQYQEHGNSLKYAAADAQALVKLLDQQQGKLYKTVIPQILADQEATAAEIRTALRSFTNVQEDDTVILFLAGHGTNNSGDYFFLPYDVKIQRLRDTAIQWQELQTALEQVPAGKRILMVDTCHSDKAVNLRLVNDTTHNQITLISATDPKKGTIAEESDDLNHGVFTYALLQGLQGQADSGGDKSVSTTELQSYLYNKIRELTDDRQKPLLKSSDGVFQDFVLTKTE